MYIIAGLGNPERKYDGTRHNVGFDTIDELASRHEIKLSDQKFKGFFGKGMIDGEKVILVKPLTYMNLSGECIGEMVNYYKVDPCTELIVISDDIDQEPGFIKVRPKGSAGGHNGLKNIIAHLGTDEFRRVRVGVGAKPKGMDLADYVLGHFDKKDRALVDAAIESAASAVETIMESGPDAAMNLFNGKRNGEQ